MYWLDEIREGGLENQGYRASGLTLMTVAIALWNTVYIERTIESLKRKRSRLMTNCSLSFRRWVGSISILMGIMFGVIILNRVQGSTDHYALSISDRTKNSLSVGYFPFSKRTPE